MRCSACKNKGCEGEPVAVDGPVSVSGDGDYSTSFCASPVATGIYSLSLHDALPIYNKEVVSGCADEPVVVGPASPSIATTQLPGSGVVGATFKEIGRADVWTPVTQ